MALLVLKVGIIAVRQEACGDWAHESLRPIAALPDAPDLAPWSPLNHGTGGETGLFYAGEAELELHSAATSHYRDNLQSHMPSLWIATEPEGARWRIRCITADPYEGEALIETAADRVESIAMPSHIVESVARFIDEFHVERPFIKRERIR